MKRLNPDKKYSVPKPRSETEGLVLQLHRAASNWYKTNNPEYVKQYHDIYYDLRSHGWNGAIDIDAELPDALMPQEYMKQIDDAVRQHHEEMAGSQVLTDNAIPRPEKAPGKILLVDSDVEMRTLIGQMLQLSGYAVSTARDGDQALARAATDVPDLILMDIRLPDMDGLEVMKHLREDSGTNVPVILLTASPESHETPAFTKAGVVEYVDKNADKPRLILDVLEGVDRQLPSG